MAERKRAPAGFGTPFQDARGYWNIQIRNGMKRGRTDYKRIRCKTVEGLKKKVDDFETKRARGVIVGTKTPALAVFLRSWIEHTVKTRNRFRTHERYAQIVEDYLIPWLDPKGTRPIDKVTREHGQAMINELARPDAPKRPKGLAPRSLRNVRAVLRRALNVAMQDGYVARNIAKAMDVPKEPTIKRRTLTPDEARHILATVKGEWLEALYWTALLMGFREGELCGFQVADLDLDKGILHPRQGMQRQKVKGEKGKLVAIELKTEESSEPLPVPPSLVPVLQTHLERLEEARGQSTWKESGMLFPSTKGTPLEPRNLVRHFKGLLKRATLPDIPFHNLRHTCGTLLAEMGQHPRVIQAVLRHASYYTTMKFYVHARDATQAAAMDGLGTMLAEPERAIEIPTREPARRT